MVNFMICPTCKHWDGYNDKCPTCNGKGETTIAEICKYHKKLAYEFIQKVGGIDKARKLLDKV